MPSLVSVNLRKLIGPHAIHLALIEADLDKWEDIHDLHYHIDLAVINTREHENDLLKILSKEEPLPELSNTDIVVARK